MSRIFTHARLMIVAICCLALGAGISAIATAGATTSGSSHAARAGHRDGMARFGAWAGHRRGMARFGGRAVHGDIVVATPNGFAHVVFDRGTVKTVNGQQLTIDEGTRKATYQTVTLTIPSDAKVRDNRQAAALSAVKPGQRVMVVTAPKHTFVIARSPKAG